MLVLLAPVAPHMTEELWSELGHEENIHDQAWLKVDEAALLEEEVTIVLQVNGKVGDRIQVPAEIDPKALEQKVLSIPKLNEWTQGKTVVKVITVPGKLVNMMTLGSYPPRIRQCQQREDCKRWI